MMISFIIATQPNINRELSAAAHHLAPAYVAFPVWVYIVVAHKGSHERICLTTYLQKTSLGLGTKIYAPLFYLFYLLNLTQVQ